MSAPFTSTSRPTNSSRPGTTSSYGRAGNSTAPGGTTRTSTLGASRRSSSRISLADGDHDLPAERRAHQRRHPLGERQIGAVDGRHGWPQRRARNHPGRQPVAVHDVGATGQPRRRDRERARQRRHQREPVGGRAAGCASRPVRTPAARTDPVRTGRSGSARRPRRGPPHRPRAVPGHRPRFRPRRAAPRGGARTRRSASPPPADSSSSASGSARGARPPSASTMSEMSSLLRRRPLSRRAIDELDPALVGRDVRALASPVPHTRALGRLSRAGARVVALVAIDVGSVAVALYTGLALKDAVDRPRVLWGLVWRAEAQWLPFIALVMLLVFARAGLYRRGGQRPGDGTVVASVALTTAIIAGFAFATGHHSGTYAIWIWTLVIATLLIIVLRRSFDSAAWLVQRATGHIHRVVICGGGPEAGTRLDRPDRRRALDARRDRRPGAVRRRPRDSDHAGPRGRRRADAPSRRRGAARGARHLHAARRAPARRADGGAAAGARGRLRPGPVGAAVRDLAAHAAGDRLPRQAGVRHRRRRPATMLLLSPCCW